MTQLKITCDKAKKTLKFTGDKIAVGEHCRIVIEGLGEVGVDNLRLRVLVNDETIARFPLEGQSWDADLSCELNLNTVQAKEIVQCCAQGLFVLDDTSVPQLYGMGMCHLGPWPQENGEDVPYDLSGYPDNIEAFKTEIENFRQRVTAAEDAASAAKSSAKISSEQSTLSAKSASQAASSASQAQAAAERAEAAVSTALKRQFVSALPSVGSPNIIYLVPSAHPVSGDERDEYMWNDAESKWEMIGSSATTVVLDNTVTEFGENGVKSKGIWAFVKELFGKLATVATSGSYNDLVDKPDIPDVSNKLNKSGDPSLLLTKDITIQNGNDARIFTFAQYTSDGKLKIIAFQKDESGRTIQSKLTLPLHNGRLLNTYDVVDPSVATTDDQVAGALATKNVLAGKVTNFDSSSTVIRFANGPDGNNVVFVKNENGAIIRVGIDVGDNNFLWIDKDTGISLRSKALSITDTNGSSYLSGITEQDIKDFLKYRGQILLDDSNNVAVAYYSGDVVHASNRYERFTEDMPKGASITTMESVVIADDSGFQKLVELYGKNKAALFADTAFKTKVEEIIDEHGGGGGGDMKFVLKYNSEKDVIYFDDGVNA